MDTQEPTPRITFGIIVLNGEPFTKYCLRSLYPFAHEIIVVEGAAPGAAQIATRDGHSTDGTRKSLKEFKEREDPQDKVVIVTRDGFWSEKDEMSRAYATRATGDYLWQVDIDEFYKPEDMSIVLRMLRDDPTITAVSFKQIQFWGGFHYWVDGWQLRMGGEQFHRLFKWGSGYVYKTHRPPTVLAREGMNTRKINWISGYEMERRGILLYHYSFVFPKQVEEKCQYYSASDWADRKRATDWADQAFSRLKRPFHVHNDYEYPGWLERFGADHPEQISCLRNDLEAGKLSLDVRPTDDIEFLLGSRRYELSKKVLLVIWPLGWLIRLRLIVRRFFKRLSKDPAATLRLVLDRIRGR